MSLEIKGQSCPICKAYLFDEDEIAVCPVCGAPHHRECLVNAGKCGMEEFHGTDKQYDKQKKAMNDSQPDRKAQENGQVTGYGNAFVQCPSCKNRYPAENSFCPNCGAPNSTAGRGGIQAPFVINIDYLGGVNKDEDLGDGHRADDVKNFVAVSTNRFIPKFKDFKKGAKVKFSVWHLFFPSASYAMRKMYAFAAIAAAIEIAATLLMIPLNNAMGEIMKSSGVADYYGIAKYMAENMSKPLLSNLLLGTAGVLLQVFVRLMSGLFANKFYYKHVIKTMSEIDKTAENEEKKLLLYRMHGGVNIFAFVLVYIAVTWLPSIIFSLI